MATGPDLSSSSSSSAAATAPGISTAVPEALPAAAAKKDRHIVTWTDEEDGVLRAQIALHGTDNWTLIAAQFKDKTARQCRRRWYNYLNSECKKGGWSREEDMLLCEAQKVLGNRWTEIAKVVSGRTDNAVKNRFSTLCKRRAKDDESSQENGAPSPCSNTSTKRVLTQTGCLTPSATSSLEPVKLMRFLNSDSKENIVPNIRLFGQERSTQQDARQPLGIISSNSQDNMTKTSTKQLSCVEQNSSGTTQEGNFLNKDDPKVATLLKQADLLCSLATKMKAENTSQSMDEAWQQLQCHLMKTEDNEVTENSTSAIASLLEELDDLIVDPYENKEDAEQNTREQNEQIDMHIEHSDGPSQGSKKRTPETTPDRKMTGSPIDNCEEDNRLCRNVFSGSMEPCAGAEMQTCENLSKVAEDSGPQSVEPISPALTDIDDLIVDPYEINEEDAQKLREHSGLNDEHSSGPINEHTSDPLGTSMEVTLEIAADENMDGCPVDDCKEDNSTCTNVLNECMEPCPGSEIPASEKLRDFPEHGQLQSVESTSPSLINFQLTECAEILTPENLSEVLEDSTLQCFEFTSPAHTVLQAKAGAEILTSSKFGEVAKSSKLSSMEFTSPAHTVATFQPYSEDMPTPKFTASERNFLLSVIDLTSPESKSETSQQPSCKRALLNSL